MERVPSVPAPLKERAIEIALRYTKEVDRRTLEEIFESIAQKVLSSRAARIERRGPTAEFDPFLRVVALFFNEVVRRLGLKEELAADMFDELIRSL